LVLICRDCLARRNANRSRVEREFAVEPADHLVGSAGLDLLREDRLGHDCDINFVMLKRSEARPEVTDGDHRYVVARIAMRFQNSEDHRLTHRLRTAVDETLALQVFRRFNFFTDARYPD